MSNIQIENTTVHDVSHPSAPHTTEDALESMFEQVRQTAITTATSADSISPVLEQPMQGLLVSSDEIEKRIRNMSLQNTLDIPHEMRSTLSALADEFSLDEDSTPHDLLLHEAAKSALPYADAARDNYHALAADLSQSNEAVFNGVEQISNLIDVLRSRLHHEADRIEKAASFIARLRHKEVSEAEFIQWIMQSDQALAQIEAAVVMRDLVQQSLSLMQKISDQMLQASQTGGDLAIQRLKVAEKESARTILSLLSNKNSTEVQLALGLQFTSMVGHSNDGQEDSTSTEVQVVSGQSDVDDLFASLGL
jgi:hypothetical protein